MADHGLSLYGNAIIVNTDFASSNKLIVKSFLKATAAGWKDAIADPSSAAQALIKRNPAADADLEERRLLLAVEANVLTDYVLDNGMGMIDSARMDKAIMQLGETYEYTNATDATLYFTDEFLPTGGFSLK